MLRNDKWEKQFFKLALLERQEKQLAIEQFLAGLTTPENLTAIFDEFIDSTRTATHHHTDSYNHDNGYDKIIMFQDADTKMKMRLHVWEPVLSSGPGRPRQNIHNHRWDFSSVVLIGELDHLSYQFAPESKTAPMFNHYRYFARGSKEHYELESLGKAKVMETDRVHLAKGDYYSVRNEVLHRIDVPNDALVATLVVTHENVGWVTNDLLSERSLGMQRVALPSPAMTREQIVEKVEFLRAELDV